LASFLQAAIAEIYNQNQSELCTAGPDKHGEREAVSIFNN